MKVLYVDLKYDYGLASRGLNDIGRLGFEKGFRDLGHEVDCFYYDDYLQSNREVLQKELIQKAKSWNPDIIFFVFFKDHFSFETLDVLKSEFITINWFGDDTWRFESFSSKFSPHLSFSVTTDKWSVDKYKELDHQVKVIRSQWASLEFEVNDNNFSGYEFDVSFVGAAQRVRKWFVKELGKQGVNVNCFGHGWTNGPVSGDRMREIFRASKINLNLSNSNTLDVRFLLSSLKGFYNGIFSPKTASQIKARNFEIPYCGGFQMTDYVPGIEDYFEIGKELVCYKDVNEAAHLIKYYLKNQNERESIRKACIQRVRTEHTYTNRLKEVLKEIDLHK